MNLTHFCPKLYGKFEKKNNSSVNIRFVDKTSDIRNFSQNIKSDVKTPEVATLRSTLMSDPLPAEADCETC